jgi:hypothetical protein
VFAYFILVTINVTYMPLSLARMCGTG